MGPRTIPLFPSLLHTYSQSVIGLVEGDELSGNAASGRYSVPKSMANPWQQEYRTDEQAGRCTRTGLWHVSRPNQNSASAGRVQRNPFIYARKLKLATDLLGQKRDVTWRHRRN
jgi:hypothetical protein